MKFIYAATMTLSLIGIALLAMLGMAYVYEGSGLNPYLAGIVSAFMLWAGLYAAAQLARGEE